MRTKLLLLYMLWAGMVWGQTSENIPNKNIDKNKQQQISKKDEQKVSLPKRKGCWDKTSQEIIYNYSTGIFEKSVIKPCQKVPTVLKIKNINTYFYDIQIQAKDINMNAEAIYDTPIDIRKTTIVKIDTTAVLNILDTKTINSISGFSTIVKSKDKTGKIRINALEEISKKETNLILSEKALQKSESLLRIYENKKSEIEDIDIYKKKREDLLNLPDSLKTKKNQIINEIQVKLNTLENKYGKTDIRIINDSIELQKKDLATKNFDVYLAKSQLDRQLFNLKNKNEILAK